MIKMTRSCNEYFQNCIIFNRLNASFWMINPVSCNIFIPYSVNMNKKGDSNLSVSMRIMTNYFQVLTSAMSYNLKFPEFIIEFFAPIRQIGATSDSVMSFDCFLSDHNSVTESTAYFKILLLAIIPLPVILLYGTFWTLLGLCWKRFRDIKRSIIVSTLTIIFILHPTLINSTFQLFICVDLDEGVSKTSLDLDLGNFNID
jgi:uncharacterized membrane protein YhaH (DUF805 family)